MRLFVAIDIPDSIKDHLAFLQRSLEPSPGVAMVHPKNAHLTLNFLGDCSEHELGEIVHALKKVSFESFSLKLSGIGFFPSFETPRVCWVGLEENKSLLALQRQVDLLFIPDKSFKPHLTLARIRNSSLCNEDAFIAKTQSLLVNPLVFRVKSFRLYKSVLTPVGAIHEVLETFKASH